MKKLHRYTLKLTALSPIHIGTGEVYEPTNFVIDKNKLYQFDELLFYKGLSEIEKKTLYSKMGNWMQVIDFYKSKKEDAIKLAHFVCDVSSRVQKQYDKKMNQDGTKNKNQLEIQSTFKNPNTHRAIIPGSSIKGMLNTILKIYPDKIKDNTVRQNLMVSDALLLEGDVEIGYGDRQHRSKDKPGKGVSSIVEVIKKNSTFIMTLNTSFSFEELKRAMSSYHAKRDDSIYHDTHSSFVARVGKYSGMDYMVDVEDISTLRNSYKKPLATYNLYSSDAINDAQFGWIHVEIISEESYQEYLKNIESQEKQYHTNRKERQRETKERAQKEKALAKEAELKKEQEQKEEEQKRVNEELKIQKELEAMTPVQRLIFTYNDLTLLINDMRSGKIDNFENVKFELARNIKEKLQDEPKMWENAKKKALIRKEYIQAVLDEK